jgi:hypothetical protein
VLRWLKRFLPLRMAAKAGSLMLFEATFLDFDDDEPDEAVSNTSLTFGFGPTEACDELESTLSPLEDDDATPDATRSHY